MAFGFPAYHTQRYTTAAPVTDMLGAVREALRALSWSVRDEGSTGVAASTRINLRSWREDVRITFLSDNSLSVISRCATPTQCFDWGKNRANVKAFLVELERQLEPAATSRG